MTKTSGNFTDFVSFSRASNGTALRRIAYGSELVTNGTFDTGDLTGWTYGSEWSYVDGKAVDSSSTFDDYLEQTITVTSGSLYLIQYSFSNIAGGTPALYISGAPAQVHSDDGDYSYMYRPSSSSFKVQFIGAAATFAVDNVSVKEVLFDDASGDLVLFNHPDDIPRVEYDASGNVKGLLIEEARTNQITYSEQFDDSSWAKNLATVTANQATAPDGTTTADLLVPSTASSNSHYVRKNTSSTSGNDYTMSVFAKAAGYTSLSLRLVNSDAPIVNYDLSAGTCDNAAGTIENVGNGWYRCSLTGNATTTGVWHYIYPNQQAAFAGDGTSGIYIWGSQTEAGSFPTSYIPTSGATATRSADICSIDVDQFGYNYTNTVGTFFADFESFSTVQTASRAMSAVSCTARAVDINMGFEALRADVYSNHTASDLYALNNPSAGRNKIAAAMAENNSAACANGGTVDVDTATGTPIVASKLEIGSYFASGYLNGHIKSIKYYPRRLTNAQLQELTS